MEEPLAYVHVDLRGGGIGCKRSTVGAEHHGIGKIVTAYQPHVVRGGQRCRSVSVPMQAQRFETAHAVTGVPRGTGGCLVAEVEEAGNDKVLRATRIVRGRADRADNLTTVESGDALFTCWPPMTTRWGIRLPVTSTRIYFGFASDAR